MSELSIVPKLSASQVRVGLRFGCIVVRRKLPSLKKKTIWECACDCGRMKPVFTCNLIRRSFDKCSCDRGLGAQFSSVRYVYDSMIKRTTNPKCRSYSRYGGRGIQVCVRWRRSFIAFAMDMGIRPNGAHKQRRRLLS